MGEGGAERGDGNNLPLFHLKYFVCMAIGEFGKRKEESESEKGGDKQKEGTRAREKVREKQSKEGDGWRQTDRHRQTDQIAIRNDARRQAL